MVDTPPEGARSVLLVDDDAVVRALMRRALEGCGLHVEDAADGVEAIALITRYPGAFRLVVIDLMMPRMPGDAAARKIHALAPDVKIVATSGLDPDTACRLFMESGTIDVFLPKPFRGGALRATVEALLGQPTSFTRHTSGAGQR